MPSVLYITPLLAQPPPLVLREIQVWLWVQNAGVLLLSTASNSQSPSTNLIIHLYSESSFLLGCLLFIFLFWKKLPLSSAQSCIPDVYGARTSSLFSACVLDSSVASSNPEKSNVCSFWFSPVFCNSSSSCGWCFSGCQSMNGAPLVEHAHLRLPFIISLNFDRYPLNQVF